MKFFGYFKEPQIIVPRVPEKAIQIAFTSNIIIFYTLLIFLVTVVASLHRFEGLLLKKNESTVDNCNL